MKFWHKDNNNEHVVQALVNQLERKDTQIGELMERQREANILLKNDQEQMLQLRESTTNHIPYASMEDHRDQVFEQAKLRASANKHSFLNWVLIASLMVLSYGFLYWVKMMNTASETRDTLLEQKTFELGKARNSMTLLMRDIEDGYRKVDQLSINSAVAKKDRQKKEDELTSQLISQSSRIKELEKINYNLMSKGLSENNKIPTPPRRRR